MKKRASVLILLACTGVLFAQDALQEVVVNPGDTMWSIANKYLKDPQRWPDIVRVNNLPTADPTLALPGTRIRIPVALIKEEFRTAQLVKMEADVRYKRKTETDFKPANPDMILRYEDSLRTMKGGLARVKFPSNETIQINENSLVVLKPEKILQEVQLMQGAVQASKARVIMPGGTVVHPQNKNSQYQAKVREDESEVVFVYKGEVNVTAQGKTVRVKEGFGTQVPKSAPPLEPMPLKEFKDFNPADFPTSKLVTKSAAATTPPPKAAPTVVAPPPPTENSGSKAKSIVNKNMLASYHLQLAKDEDFRQIVFEKTDPTGAPFDIRTQPGIPDGTYFTRVAFLDLLGNQGAYSTPAMVIKDTVPPAITLSSPQEGQTFAGTGSYCDVIGRVRGAVSVTVNDRNIFTTPEGQFSTVAHFKEGENEIRIVARDGAGNEIRLIRKVIYKSK